MFGDFFSRLQAAFEILFPKVDLGKVWFVGAVLALVMSWGASKSVVLALFHGLCSWLYVLYYVLSNA